MSPTFFTQKKLPVFLQDQIAECGITSLAMILNFHGLNIDLPSLRNKYPVSNMGNTLYDLIDICENEGFTADAYEMTVDDMPQITLPAVLHWDLNHFVVLKKLTKGKYVIHDPAHGEIALDDDEFSRHFSGFALEITPLHNEEFNEVKSAWERDNQNKKLTLSYFVKRTDGLIKSLSFVLFMAMVAQLFTMSIPTLTKVIIDDFIVSHADHYFAAFVAGGVGLIAFRYIADLVRSWSVIFIGFRWHANFSSYFFLRMLKLPMDYFDKRNVSDIASRFSALEELKDALTERVVQGVLDGIMSIVTIVAMSIYSPKLSVISITLCSIYFILRRYLVSLEVKANQKQIMHKVKEVSSFYDSVMNIQSIKIYGREKERYQQWKKNYLNAANESISLAKARMWYASSENLLSGLEQILILGVGGYLVMQGELTLGMLFAFIAYQTIFSTQSKSMFNHLLELKLLGVHIDRLNDIENTPIEANTHGVNTSFKPSGNLELKNVCFKYPGAADNIIDNLSLKIDAGENVVITGGSGVGKTTLLKIMMGLLVPDSGAILIDGKDIRTIGLKHYRKHIASVNQKETLISGSVLDNVTFFSKPVDESRVLEATRLAAVEADITSKPMGFQTVVGASAETFSGGQEQRILIARALYNQPTYLFMDEATAYLDVGTEKHVVDSIKSLNVTRISIAHRQETIDMADRILHLGE